MHLLRSENLLSLRPWIVAMGAALLSIASPAVQAQTSWPVKTIRIIVPFGPGGASDILARLIAKDLSEKFKQAVIVENKAGAGGTIGADLVAKSAPDGYTMLLADSSVVMTFPSLYPNLPYAAKDLLPVANIATFGLILIAPSNSKFNTIADLVAADRAAPGKLNMASPGSGSSNHLTLEKFNSLAGTKLVHIPYKGTGPAIADLVGGQVDLTLASGAASKPLIEGGKVKAIAVTSPNRSPSFPEIPTAIEQGLAGFNVTSWYGLWVPKGTSPDVVKRLHALVNKAFEDPDLRALWFSLGAEQGGIAPEEFSSFIKREVVKWGKVVQDANLTPE